MATRAPLPPEIDTLGDAPDSLPHSGSPRGGETRSPKRRLTPMGLIRTVVAWNRSLAAGCIRRFPSVFRAPSYLHHLLAVIAEAYAADRPRVILEAGGVDRPILRRSDEYRFVGLDIEKRENCNHLYDEFVIQSIEVELPQRFDMIVSYTLLEHVPNNRAAIRSIFAGLNPGGSTHHYVPSAWHPYSIATRLVGPTIQKRLIPILRPGTEAITGYPTFFNHCTPGAMRRLFRETGFESIEIQAFYRASDYFAFFFPAFVAVTLFENLCARFGWTLFASGFVISARRPKAA